MLWESCHLHSKERVRGVGFQAYLLKTDETERVMDVL